MIDLNACITDDAKPTLIRTLSLVAGGCTFVATVFMLILLGFFHKRDSSRELEDITLYLFNFNFLINYKRLKRELSDRKGDSNSFLTKLKYGGADAIQFWLAITNLMIGSFPIRHYLPKGILVPFEQIWLMAFGIDFSYYRCTYIRACIQFCVLSSFIWTSAFAIEIYLKVFTMSISLTKGEKRT